MIEQTQKQGVVSIFLGVFPNRQLFDTYLHETEDENRSGITTTCPLWDDLGVAWLDHDFQDAYYQGDKPIPVAEFLLNPFSYVESFREGVIAACHRLEVGKVNSGVFLYNFAYPEHRRFPSPNLRFIGCFPYTKSTPDWLQHLLRS
jgi:hypothetical protein